MSLYTCAAMLTTVSSCSLKLVMHGSMHCRKIAEAEAAVFVNEKKWLVMRMHVQLKLDELRGAPNLGSL